MKRSEGGYTLVEAMTVVLVIGILASIAIVSFVGVTAQARDSARATRASAIALRLEHYYKYGGISSRGREYPSGDTLLANLSSILEDTSIAEDPAHSGVAIKKGCVDSGAAPASGDNRYYFYCAQTDKKQDCDTVVDANNTSYRDPCVSFVISYYKETDKTIHQVNSVWAR